MLIKTAIKSSRPSFLILSPICLFLGISTSFATQQQISLFMSALVFVGAISAHISVNMLNEYLDFKSGLDFKTEKTAFSGGSASLLINPGMANSILTISLTFLVLTIIIGIYLIREAGIEILPIGIAGVVLIVTYTQWLNKSPFLCLLAPGFGFGVLMVVGTHMILTGESSHLPWAVSMVPFFLVNNLLLLNQYPDMKADTSIGRKTFPIAFGLYTSNLVYIMFFMTTYVLIFILISVEYIPVHSIISVFPIVFSLFALRGAKKHASRIGESPQYLAANVAATALTPLLLGISIIIG